VPTEEEEDTEKQFFCLAVCVVADGMFAILSPIYIINMIVTVCHNKRLTAVLVVMLMLFLSSGCREQESYERFLHHMTGLHRNIQFTMEIERDSHLPFLDIDIYRRPDG
jgi:hypothetical protein